MVKYEHMYASGQTGASHLFSDFEDELNDLTDSSIKHPSVEFLPVDGLCYIPAFITSIEEKQLLAAVDPGPWNQVWQRRTQRFGQRYDDWSDEPAETLLPHWVVPYADRLAMCGAFSENVNQVGINEYLPGQGIAPHTDRHGGPVASLSLGSGCVMDLVSLFGKPTVSFWLAPRSIIIIKGEARSAWKHGIARRQRDVIDGRIYVRRRRVSITFRDLVRPDTVEPTDMSSAESATATVSNGAKM